MYIYVWICIYGFRNVGALGQSLLLIITFQLQEKYIRSIVRSLVYSHEKTLNEKTTNIIVK